MSLPAGLETQSGSSMLMNIGLILDSLKHLSTVISNESLYLNSIKLRGESIRHVCDVFWCDADPLSDNKTELCRMKSTMELTSLVEKAAEKHQLVKTWVEIDKRLRNILPQKTTFQLNEAVDSSWSLFLDPKIITLSLIDVSIKLCESIRRLKTKMAIHEAIINVIHKRFLRPLNLLLWSYAKRDVLE